MAPAAPTDSSATERTSLRDIAFPALAGLVIVIVFQFLGPWKISLGPAAITLYPMVWALVTGTIISAQKFVPLGKTGWRVADACMGVAVSALVARLAFDIGPNLKVLANAGPALFLQEIGHLGGTIAVALPIAVLLRMGRATVGATFSIDREAAFAMVSDRFGSRSAEYRGVLSMYVFGTLFGALTVAVLASLFASLDIFDPLALAMGVGVGSGSMMAAGGAAIADAHPEVRSEVLAMAATSNMITLILGTYVGVWIALPLADKFYNLLTRYKDVNPDTYHGSAATLPAGDDVGSAGATKTMTKAAAKEEAALSVDDIATEESHGPPAIGLNTALAIVIGLCFVTCSIAAWKTPPTGKVFSAGSIGNVVIGLAIVAALTLVSVGLTKLTRGKITPVIWASTIGTLLSSPVSPVAKQAVHYVESVNFLAMCTVVLACAGLSMGRNLPMMRKIGWRVVPVGFAAILASFLLATIIAEFTLGLV